MISKKPSRSPSWKLSPTEMKVVGTPVATPTVYWISKFASIPALRALCVFWPPSRVCKVNVVVDEISGRNAFKNAFKR